MKHGAQLAGLALLIALGSVPVWAAPGSVSGLVRNSAGVPQIGARVELLRPDLSVVASAYTNDEGQFTIASILPGHYALKAMNTSFLPSLRENVHVRGGRTVVNLTLNTLYEVMEWLPAEPRSRTAQSDDWTWTLRSAADRPLLRWLEDGPLVVVTDGSGGAPKLKARLMATGQAGAFGESGQRFSATVEDTPENSRELLARVDFDPHSNAGLESMLGFRQELGYAGSVQSVAAVAIHPEVESPGGQGLNEVALSSRETMHLGDLADVEVGSTEVLARGSGSSIAQSLPFATVAFRRGNSVLRYRMATMIQEPGGEPGGEETEAAMPRLSSRDGALALEHGLHQEIGWERNTDSSGMAFLVYADSVDNPVLEASAHFAEAGSAAQQGVLFDPESGLARVAGPGFSSIGVEAAFDRRLPGDNHLHLSYADGNAVVMPALGQTEFSKAMAAAHTRRVQAYSLSVSGTLDGTRTRWRASYRWQPDDSATAVAPYAVDALAPYLGLRLCQGLRKSGSGAMGVEALLEVQNLLAQGYHPFLLSDGSILIFAQSQRMLRAGVAFTF